MQISFLVRRATIYFPGKNYYTLWFRIYCTELLNCFPCLFIYYINFTGKAYNPQGHKLVFFVCMMNKMLVAKKEKKINWINKFHILWVYSGGGDESYKQENSSEITKCFPSRKTNDWDASSQLEMHPVQSMSQEMSSGKQLCNKINFVG
jgi:hypothetical protein